MRYPIGTGDGVNSSAVQLGKYVYYTAAHVVIDPTNQALTGLVVRPALHLPIGFESTPAIPVDAFFESGYTYDPSGVRGHDIAYLRAQKPHPIAAGGQSPLPEPSLFWKLTLLPSSFERQRRQMTNGAMGALLVVDH